MGIGERYTVSAISLLPPALCIFARVCFVIFPFLLSKSLEQAKVRLVKDIILSSIYRSDLPIISNVFYFRTVGMQGTFTNVNLMMVRSQLRLKDKKIQETNLCGPYQWTTVMTNQSDPCALGEGRVYI